METNSTFLVHRYAGFVAGVENAQTPVARYALNSNTRDLRVFIKMILQPMKFNW
ncbi:MAG: hypothetical protein IPL23_26815 [Saprospiraceae bacterium]|nr:hypothetical protein [Saprospiraceae bacterium]